jgi:hypothetical protein
MPTVRTRRELVNEALEQLGIVGAGQTPNAEDFETVDHKVDQLVLYLEAIDLVSIEDIDEIPAEIFQALAVLLADECALKFGMPGVPTSASNPNPVQAAQDRIKLVTYGKPTYENQRTEYF